MTWADFYLLCFAVGFAFSVISFLAGGLHIPHFHFGWHGPHVPHGVAHGAGHSHQHSTFNLFTLAAFLTWFGGAGFLLTRYSSIWFWLGLGVALVSGLAGAAIISLFLSC